MPGRSTSSALRAEGIERDLGAARLHRQRGRDSALARRRDADRPAGRTRPPRAPACFGWHRGAAASADDPLRLVRAARIAAEVRLDPDSSAATIGARAVAEGDSVEAGAAGERQLAELRLLLGRCDPNRGLALLDQLGASATVLPELEALRGVEQNPYHHLDVHGHTLEVLERLIVAPGRPRVGGGGGVRRPARSRFSPSRWRMASRGAARCALRPCFTMSASPTPEPWERGEGALGSSVMIEPGPARDRARDLRASAGEPAASWGHLANSDLEPSAARLPGPRAPRSRAATSTSTCAPPTPTLRGRHPAHGGGSARDPGGADKSSKEAIDAHLELAAEMIGEALVLAARRPAPRSPIRGDDLAGELGIW